MNDHAHDRATATFVAHRNLLFTVAYEMLGSAADAEDVLQETWLRWVKRRRGRGARPRAPTWSGSPPGRRSTGCGRWAAAGRTYVGPWLPEPLLTAPDVAEDAELAESVSMAMMLVLETLTPDRAGRVRAARGVRRAATRRSRLPSRRARRPCGRSRTGPASTSTPAARVRSSAAGETQAALASVPGAPCRTATCRACWMCSPLTLCCVSDGGGVKQAALRPIVGAQKVVHFIIGGTSKTTATIAVEPTVVNGSPALIMRLDGEVDGIMAIQAEGGFITGLYFVRNPQKLTRIEAETPLTLHYISAHNRL